MRLVAVRPSRRGCGRISRGSRVVVVHDGASQIEDRLRKLERARDGDVFDRVQQDALQAPAVAGGGQRVEGAREAIGVSDILLERVATKRAYVRVLCAVDGEIGVAGGNGGGNRAIER